MASWSLLFNALRAAVNGASSSFCLQLPCLSAHGLCLPDAKAERWVWTRGQVEGRAVGTNEASQCTPKAGGIGCFPAMPLLLRRPDIVLSERANNAIKDCDTLACEHC